MSGPNLVTLIASILGAATILALVQAAIPGVRPWTVAVDCARRTLKSWPRQLYLLAGLSILLANYAYLASGLDEWCTRRVIAWRGEDFAPLIHRAVEGDAVARLQAAVAWRPLTCFFGYVYIVVFPSLTFAAILVFDHRRSRRGLALVLLGYLFNYLLVLPFYMACPVLECHEFYARFPGYPAAARLLLNDISPLIMQSYRSMSGLDNCFPSFHTSLALTMAFVAWHAGRRFGWLITFFAVSNVLSTVYLGIHWLTDVAAGIATAAAACGLARLASRPWADEAGAQSSQYRSRDYCLLHKQCNRNASCGAGFQPAILESAGRMPAPLSVALHYLCRRI